MLIFFTEERFVTEEELLFHIVETQLAPTPIARAKYCEESLLAAVLTGTTQYVILGAGLDSFAFREKDLMQKLQVYETDRKETLEDKKRRIAAANLEVPENLHFVPLDIGKDDIEKKLSQNGFNKRYKTFFSLLGVSYYLSEESLTGFFKQLSGFAADGSTLLFDMADENLFNSEVKRVKNMLAMASASGEEIHTAFSYEKLETLLSENDFLIYEHLKPADITERYFADGKTAFEHIHYFTAVLKKSQCSI